MKVVEHMNWARLLDCGNGDGIREHSDSVVFAFSRLETQDNVTYAYPHLLIQNGLDSSSTNKVHEVFSNTELKKNEWSHLAATYDGEVARIYINGKQTGSTNISSSLGPRQIIRNRCFIGKSWYYGDSLPNAYFSEIMILDFALNNSEISSIVNHTAID